MNKNARWGRFCANNGFTLIELLVVVLIIGILAAVALPQYQVAVKKADLSRYMGLVAAMREAEDLYYLANGEYTDQIENLDIGLPIDASCTLANSGLYYDCGNVRMGIFNGCNVQAGDNTIRYVQFFCKTKRSLHGKSARQRNCLSSQREDSYKSLSNIRRRRNNSFQRLG